MNRATPSAAASEQLHCNFEDIQEQNFDGLIVTDSRESRNTPAEHLNNF
ncbi:hypothetical protein C22711_5416 [Escherichia coli O104:H4 str. C227-11]|nr:hypothetical protein C22711_5416 [Escherichia coli O104:H4 str. C227-11]